MTKTLGANRSKDLSVYTAPVSESGTPYLTASQVSEWLRCRYKYHLRYVRNIAARVSRRPMELGSATHIGISAALHNLGKARLSVGGALSRKDVMRDTIAAADRAIEQWASDSVKRLGGHERMTEEEHEQYHEISKDAPVIVAELLADLKPHRWKTLRIKGEPLIERSLTCPIVGGSKILEGSNAAVIRKRWAGFHGTPDWVFEDGDGIWVLDWKIRKTFTPSEDEELSVQGYSYVKLVNMNGIPATGSVMAQIKAQVPSVPKLNKDGSVSRADIATTWEHYSNFVRSAGLDPNDYLDMKAKLENKQFRSLARVHRGENETHRFWQGIVTAAAWEIAARSDFNIRQFGMLNCRGCWARKFCLAELADHDTDFLLQTDYVDLKNPKDRLILGPEDIIFSEDDN